MRVISSIQFEQHALGDSGVRLLTRVGGAPASYGDFLTALHASSDVRNAFTRALADVPFDAFVWECRSVSPTDLGLAMDMVAIESRPLAMSSPDPSPFREHLEGPSGSRYAARFENLGRDAELVVPRRMSADAAYTHLARFVREAPAEQVNAFWCEVADAVRSRLQRGRRVWLSTAGLGVSWLHVRIDERPKYYRHSAFAV